jgi:hypothetical protein
VAAFAAPWELLVAEVAPHAGEHRPARHDHDGERGTMVRTRKSAPPCQLPA